MRQRINLRFRSTAWSASLSFPVPDDHNSCTAPEDDETDLVGSIIGARSATRAPSLPCMFFSHPTALGFSELVGPPRRTPKRLDGASPRQHSARTAWVASGWTARRYARRLRSGHPGAEACAEGSRKPLVR